ncbi:hypothetical protein C6988_07380 [Nitrosopumilus sp. b1]|uniref:hypothetical protein n=1 Tax=Nitrosopumilus sp. b1 TaxID=2109907 RepID=UPI0015F4FB53|nr:hypothetical protein [Nitrosopumilus sp. b1]KAF6242496.1 hypothetical protein C6988_07380 [Nitrosopumilus sp. b1]
MDSPLSVGPDGIKIKPELMEREKLYHCLFDEKILLVYKDSQDVLNCYEVEEKELVDNVKTISNNDEIEKIFQDYIEKQNLKN